MGAHQTQRAARRRFGAAVKLVAFASIAASVMAHVRLRYSSNGAALYWENPQSISLVIQSDGSDDIGDGSHETAIRNAIDEWNGSPGSRARIVESTSNRSRRDWQTNDVHLVVFDENNSSGYFSGGSSIVAITPVTFFTDGRIIDADVLFNGKNFGFTTSGEVGKFDIQDVAAHELGHLLGLDHSGVCGATMFPYVDPSVILHRSLALDDQRGMRHLYPTTSFARIAGRIVRQGGEDPVAGAHVAARDGDGHIAAAILADANGNFVLQGLDSGSYEVIVDPLDQPVSSSNLGGGQVIVTNFESKVLGTISATVGQEVSIGTHSVGGDVAIQMGRVADDYPLRAVRGAVNDMVVRGTGLVAGSSLTSSDPGIAIQNVSWNATYVTFDAVVPGGTALGHVDLIATNPQGETDFLVGGVEITPPDPVVSGVSPSSGEAGGGTLVTILGSNFRSGARVVVGNRVYRDGDLGGCVVADANTITLTTSQTIAGNHDVVVIDPTGVEGRRTDSFNVVVPPVLDVVFPAVGTMAGGTRINLSGNHFVEGVVVTIDGVIQSNLVINSPTRMQVVTESGIAGGPYVLNVQSPDGSFAEAAFTYVDAPDPRITMVTPDASDMSGGATVSVLGSGFNGDTRVFFGVDPQTGTGGRMASTELVDVAQVRTVTPSNSVGTTSVMVKDMQTGQVSTLESGFTYTGQEPVDGGGAGCAAVIVPGPPTWKRVIGGSGWILLALILGIWHSRAVLRDARVQAL